MNIQTSIINDSLDFFTTLVKLVTFKKESTKYTKADEETSSRIIDLVKNGFVMPLKVRTLTTSEFSNVFDELAGKAEKYANSISEFTGAELIDDKYYRIREASIFSFLVLTDAMKSLKIIDRLDNPINILTLREYLYIYHSHLYLLNTETGTSNLKFAAKVCGDACKNLNEKISRIKKRGEHYEWFETLFAPMALMGLSSGINFDMLLNEGKVNRKSYMVTGLGLYVINFLKSHSSQQYTLDKASYKELIINLNNIFDFHKWIVKNIADLISESPLSIYSKYNGDKSYLVSMLELDLASFMLSITFQYDEMLNNVKISPKDLADFPRLELPNILNRVYLA
jgi:hypothetical protein